MTNARTMVFAALDVGLHWVTSRLRPWREGQCIFLSHPLDYTGGAWVLGDIVQEICAHHGSQGVRVIAPSAAPGQQEAFARLGISIEQTLRFGVSAAKAHLRVAPSDLVFMNTSAIDLRYFEGILELLESGQLTRAYWFLHEAVVLFKVINPALAQPRFAGRISALANTERLTLLTPSDESSNAYAELFACALVRTINLKINPVDCPCSARSASDYDELHFLLPGGTAGGIKGHVLALAAFHELLAKRYSQSPSAYRRFHVHVVAFGEDFISQQIQRIGIWLLGDRFHMYPNMPRADAMRIFSDCNVIVCCSLSESFPMSIVEGMLFQHVVLRNDCPGQQKQLQEGVNGYAIDTNRLDQFADRLHDLLSLETSSAALQRMGAASRELALELASSNYYDQLIKLPGWLDRGPPSPSNDVQ